MTRDLEGLAAHLVDLVAGRGEAIARAGLDDHGLTRFANSFIHQHVGERTTGVSLTVAVDGRVAAGATSDLRADALAGFVDATVEAARLQPVDPHWPGVAPPADVAVSDQVAHATVEAAPRDRAVHVRQFVDAAPDLAAAGFVDTAVSRTALVTSAGQHAHGALSRATVDGIHQTTTSAGGGHQTDPDFAVLAGGAIGALAADRARRSATFTDLEPGTYEVVLAPECVATIAVFLGVYGFGGKSILEGSSFVEVGAQQFDPAVTLHEDALRHGSLALAYDAEGTPRRRLALIADGVTAGVLHDRRTAKRAGTVSTGHATGSATAGPMPSSLVVAGGATDPDDLVAAVERGLLVTTFNYCRVLDPKSLVVTGLTRNGTFLIEEGRITGAVGNLRFTQSFVDALGPGAVLGVGDDGRWADSEFGAGLAVAPSLRLGAWAFTGGAQG